MHPAHLPCDGLLFLLASGENLIWIILADDGPVGGDDLDVEFVELLQLNGLRRGRASHSADSGVERDEMLQSHGTEHHPLKLGPQSFLGIYRGLESGGPAAVDGD